MKFEARFPLDYPVILRKPQKSAPRGKKAEPEAVAMMGKSFNLSRGGLGIRIPDPAHAKKLKRDSEWLLTVSYGDHLSNTSHTPIEMRVRVVWIDGQNCGLAIVEMSAEARGRYEQLIMGFETLIQTHVPQLKAA